MTDKPSHNDFVASSYSEYNNAFKPCGTSISHSPFISFKMTTFGNWHQQMQEQIRIGRQGTERAVTAALISHHCSQNYNMTLNVGSQKL